MYSTCTKTQPTPKELPQAFYLAFTSGHVPQSLAVPVFITGIASRTRLGTATRSTQPRRLPTAHARAHTAGPGTARALRAASRRLRRMRSPAPFSMSSTRPPQALGAAHAPGGARLRRHGGGTEEGEGALRVSRPPALPCSALRGPGEAAMG